MTAVWQFDDAFQRQLTDNYLCNSGADCFLSAHPEINIASVCVTIILHPMKNYCDRLLMLLESIKYSK